MDYNKITNHKSNEDGDDFTKIQNFVKPLESHLLAQFACRDRLSINHIASIPMCREKLAQYEYSLNYSNTTIMKIITGYAKKNKSDYTN